ncbi:MAG: 5'/3'-nucleotidase SurE, partial [Planctomycetes bacterium]|nr:5'/3'-nucleotidase SurE [Planctomycetota bacterium]
MHFLLTNDDGYDAEGLTALYRAIDPSHRVSIVAPADQQS